MTQLESLATELTNDLKAIGHHTPAETSSVDSSKGPLITAVVARVGTRSASSAETYAELIDLGIIRAVTVAGVPLSLEVLARIELYKRNAFAEVIASEVRLAERSAVA